MVRREVVCNFHDVVVENATEGKVGVEVGGWRSFSWEEGHVAS